MEDLTFGEQVKIILGRKGMTIKELAEIIEEQTGKKMSRQNLTQRLGRDNFQEQDMRMIASILECPFQLSILGNETAQQSSAENQVSENIWKNIEGTKKEMFNTEPVMEQMQMELPLEEMQFHSSGADQAEDEREITIGELYDIHEKLDKLEENVREEEVDPVKSVGESRQEDKAEKRDFFRTGGLFLRRRGKAEKEVHANEKKEVHTDETTGQQAETPEIKSAWQPVVRPNDAEEDLSLGELNPYTGHEYQSNSVRMHPTRIGYVQVYDRAEHKWTDMTEWAFLGYQERKRALLGREYEPPIYLD